MLRTWRRASGILLIVAGLAGLSSLGAQNPQQKQAREEAQDYFRKWLEQDVKYIISGAEKEIFQRLATEEEKERFIEQFWARRDPNPKTAQNEFKEEHYRRIAYANDHFASGYPGWRTDRGRIYILYGPPDSKDSNPSGGAYERPFHEGGGATAVYPFEIWRYRYLEDLGDDVEFEFVDKTYTGDYQLALSADEKDVFLYTAGHGMTLAEQIGMASRLDRLSFKGATRELYPMMNHRIKDSPFQRYETYSRGQAAPSLKHPELREIVDVAITFDQLAVSLRADYFVLNENQFLAPLTLELRNQDLAFEERNGVQRAELAIYGQLTTLTNRVASEFEDDVVSAFRSQDFEKARAGRTLYQKLLILDRGMRYKLDLVVKDAHSGKTGVLQHGLAPPATPSDTLAASSLLLADYIEQLPEAPADESMFVLGDFKVRPSLSGKFPEGGVLGLYFQLYNAPVDQASLMPSLQITYRIRRGDRVVDEIQEGTDSLRNIYRDGRIVVVKALPLDGLQAGDYLADIQVRDSIKDESVQLQGRFQIAPH